MSRREIARLDKPITAQFDSPSGLSCVTVQTPDSFSHRALLQGMLSHLCDKDFWAGELADREAMAQLWLDAYTATDWSDCLTSQWLLGNTRIYPEQATTVSGGAIGWVGVTGQANGGVFRQATPAINDTLTFKVALKAGSYVLNVLAAKSSSQGIQTIKLDGTTLATFDWYNASVVVNSMQNTVIGVSDDGLYTLTSEMLSKNASSANYTLSMNYIDFLRV